jgi:hypothetical protein
MITPRGSVRDREAVVAGFVADKRLLTAQTIDLHELLVSVIGLRFGRRGAGPSVKLGSASRRAANS